MPFKIIEQNDGSKILTKYFGLLTTTDIENSYSERFTDPEKIKKYKFIISDYTEVSETNISDIDIKKLSRIYKEASLVNQNVSVVAIMPTDLLFGLARMWQAYIDSIPWEHTVVRSLEEAESFLIQQEDRE